VLSCPAHFSAQCVGIDASEEGDAVVSIEARTVRTVRHNRGVTVAGKCNVSAEVSSGSAMFLVVHC
jgi:hypothetical protein